MRALIQRVRKASVSIDSAVTSSIGPGLFETLVILGKEKTIARLKDAIKTSGKKEKH